MKYTLKQNRAFEIMKSFMLERFPTLKFPLEKKIYSREANSGYGSSMDDYYKMTVFYIDENGEPWFKKFDDRDTNEDSKWEVNDKLEVLYNMFGEELLAEFIKYYFDIDILERGNKLWDWVFR